MISNDTKFGYEKILGLRGDRQDRTGQKRSLEVRADAFSRLKISKNIMKMYFKGYESKENKTSYGFGLIVVSLSVAVFLRVKANIYGAKN